MHDWCIVVEKQARSDGVCGESAEPLASIQEADEVSQVLRQVRGYGAGGPGQLDVPRSRLVLLQRRVDESHQMVSGEEQAEAALSTPDHLQRLSSELEDGVSILVPSSASAAVESMRARYCQGRGLE